MYISYIFIYNHIIPFKHHVPTVFLWFPYGFPMKHGE